MLDAHILGQARLERLDFGPHHITAVVEYRLDSCIHIGLDALILGLQVDELHPGSRFKGFVKLIARILASAR